MTRVSAVVNTRNEEANLPGCLESLRWADEIVVVDMQSQDRTVAIATEFGCRVYPHELTDYVEPARNFALAQARNSWVLVVDADERVSPGLAAWLATGLDQTEAAAFRIPRRNFYGRQWIKCCGWFPDSQLRLMKRERARYSGRIHRAPDVDGPVADLPVRGESYLAHYGFGSLEDRVAKDNKYSTISAQTMNADRKPIGATGLLARTIWAFVTAYFFQGGIRHGALGVMLACERSLATFLKYAKLWELQQARLNNRAGSSL
jgi:glycosyltransferase involved in cell wall biosynthesis